MHRTRVRHYANRIRDRRNAPRQIAAELIRSLDIDPGERRLVESIAARWTGTREVLATAAGPHEPIGELLVRAGRLTREQLESALAAQHGAGVRLGEILVRNGWLSEPELRALLAFQKRLGKVGADRAGPLQLGNLLVACGAISPEQLEFALVHHRESNQRLGDALVHGGYATERQVQQGLRLQRTLLAVALAVLLALSAHTATAGIGGVGAAHSTIGLSATILPYHRLDVLRQAATLTVSRSDVERGYVDVPGATALRALSNDQKAFTVSFETRVNVFDRVTVAGLGAPLDLGNDGGAALYAYAGRDTALELSYRFYLAAGLAPGNYPWPLLISSSVTY